MKNLSQQHFPNACHRPETIQGTKHDALNGAWPPGGNPVCWSPISPLSAPSICAGHCLHVPAPSICAGHAPHALSCPLWSPVSSPHPLLCALTLREPLASPDSLASGSGWLCRGLHCAGSGEGAERLPELSPASGPQSGRSCLNQASECWGSCLHGPPLSGPFPQA